MRCRTDPWSSTRSTVTRTVLPCFISSWAILAMAWFRFRFGSRSRSYFLFQFSFVDRMAFGMCISWNTTSGRDRIPLSTNSSVPTSEITFPVAASRSLRPTPFPGVAVNPIR